MSIFQIEDQLIINEGSEALKKQFNNYHEWCWSHGFGDCDACKRVFRKYYIPIRKEELKIKNGIIKKGDAISEEK